MEKKLILFVKMNFLKYLKTYNFLYEIRKKIENFVSKVQNKSKTKPTLYCPIPINLINLNEFSAKITYLLITKPRILQNICTLLILDICEEILQKRNFIVIQQIISPLVIIQQAIDLWDFPSGNLCSIKGVLIEYSYPQKFVRTSNWKCSSSICQEKPTIIKQKLPQSAPKCLSCERDMLEIFNARNFGDSIKGQLMPSNATFAIKSSIVKSLSFRIEDERICDAVMSLGNEYIFIGICNGDNLEVWGCHLLKSVPFPLAYNSKIEHLRLKFQNNPWTFGMILSNSIGAFLQPPDTFMHLRTGLLLSLASMGSKTPLSIVAVCEEYDVALELMLTSMNLAERCVKFSHLSNQIGVIFDEVNQNLIGGALTLAQSGVCYIGNLFSYGGKKGDIIKHAVEFGEIPVQSADGKSVPLKSAIWTLTQKPTKKKPLDLLSSLIKIFGFGWRVEIYPEQEKQIIDCILNKKNIAQTYAIPPNELKHYLASVQAIEVSLTDEALDLLKKYFVAARNARGENLHAITLEKLWILSEAHARLNQRCRALLEDALVAIQLCEIGLGECPLLSPPPKNLSEFALWLNENLLVTIIGGSAI